MVTGLEVEDLEAPAPDARISLVHLKEITGPDTGFIAPDAGPDLEDHRSNGLVLGRDQLGLDRLDQLFPTGSQLRQLLLCQRDQFRVVAGGDRVLQLGGLGLDAANLAPAQYRSLEGGSLDGEDPDLVVVGEDFRIHQLRTDHLELFVHLIQAPGEVFWDRLAHDSPKTTAVPETARL